MKAPVVLLFLKAPEPGKVKTRLAAALGDETAAAIYRRLVENQLRNIPPDWRVRVVYDPPDALECFQAWLGTWLEYRPQLPGDLGVRLAAAAAEAFAEGTETVFCIGGDCPNLCSDTLTEARSRLLEGNHLVFIPADDGGYVLVGLNSPCPEIFENIPWSTPETLLVSLNRAEAEGRKVALLPSKFDIDTRADLERILPTPGMFKVDEAGEIIFDPHDPDYKERLTNEELLKAAGIE